MSALLPSICLITDNELRKDDTTQTWDYFPEKKIEFLVKGYSHLQNNYEFLRNKPYVIYPLGIKQYHIILRQEPENSFDSEAVAVYLHFYNYNPPIKLGYIPKWLTETINSQWGRIGKGFIYQTIEIDKGKLVACRVVLPYDGYVIEDLGEIEVNDRFSDLAEEAGSLSSYLNKP